MDIIHIFASPTWGGGEQYVCDLAKEQVAHGHKVAFFSRRSALLREKVTGIGCFNELPFKGVYDLYSAVKLASYLKKNDTDIIHIHRFTDMCTTVLAKIWSGSRAKIIITRHQIKNGKKNPLYMWAYGHVHRIIFVSQIALDKWSETVNPVPDGLCTVIHNSIPDKQKTVSKGLREEYGIGSDTPVLMYAARIVPEKGIEVLLAALTKLRSTNYVLVCAGTGKEEYIDEIMKKTEEYGLKDKVIYTGLRSDVRSLMEEIDIGVCPPLMQEPFGLTSAEFMQAGKCVVTSDNGAQKEFIIDGETGVFVRSGDAEQLAHTLDRMLENKEERERIGSQARRYFEENLSYGKFYNKIMEVYNSSN